MALTLTEIFADKIDERFKKASLSDAAVNQDYSFVGAKTVKVTSVPTVEMGDYTRTGLSRFGVPTELENAIQELTLTKDRSFSFTLDKMNADETKVAAAEALARQLRERVVPEVDTYRFKQMALKVPAANFKKETITKTTAYEAVTVGTAKLDDAEVADNRVLLASPSFLGFLKNNGDYVKATELAQDRILFKGQVGEIDGMPVISVPQSRLGASVNFIIAHPSVVVAPVKLAEYRVHQDPPGISGQLVEGRVYYDAFVLDQKANGLYVSSAADQPLA